MSWREKIDRDGFAVIPAVFSNEKMDQLLEDINQTRSRRSRAGVRHALALTPVAAAAASPRLIELAREALGSPAFPFHATLFEKSPQSNWLVAWHQDKALPLKRREEVPGWGPWSVKDGVSYAHAPSKVLSNLLALRVHLDDSTAVNGALRVLPGTHALGVLRDDALDELSARITPVECIVPKGGILAMKPLLVHASSKSQTQAPRRVLHIEYATSETVAKPLDLALV